MVSTLLVETVTGDTMAGLLAARDRASGVDMVELRLDGVADLDVAGALEDRRLPVIVTCRPTWEGGRFAGDERDRERLLRAALEGGAEYVDVEWRAGFDELVAAYRSRIVLSSHDFEGVPADLLARVAAMRGVGAVMVKVAVKTRCLSEALPLREIGQAGDAVVIAMGDAGMSSRLLAARFGSRWMYAGNGVAPGQVSAARMLDEFRFRSIGPSTALYGVVGNNVTHSLSPAMHNAAFAAAGLDAVYVPLATADFADFLTYADGITLRGASVTIPFKLDAMRAASRSDALTELVGAANTLRRLDRSAGGPWEATNTDVDGFLAPLEDTFPRSLRGVRASVLGAGGSARAVAVALASKGAQVVVHARRPEQAHDVAIASGVAEGPWPPARDSWDLLVNCTPLGGAKAREMSPMLDDSLRGTMVYDLTYGPGETPLLRGARAAGCLTLDGLPMLVAQAERQFLWWTGQRPQAGVMKAAALRRLHQIESSSTGT